MKEITKSYLVGLYDLGLTKSEMKERIHVDFHTTVTTKRLEKALASFGLDLRRKPQRTDVVFVDDTPSDDNTGVAIREGYTLATDAKGFSANVAEVFAGANHDDDTF